MARSIYLSIETDWAYVFYATVILVFIGGEMVYYFVFRFKGWREGILATMLTVYENEGKIVIS